eukprot:scaffold1588_cov214-Alexandrium_tamarense.AAC.15
MTQRRDTRIGSFTNLFQAWPSFQDLLANEEYYPPSPRNNTLSRSTTCPNRGALLEAFPRKYHLNSSVSSSKDLNLNVEDWKRVSSAKKDKEVTFAEYLSLYVFQTCHPKAYSRADVDKFKRNAELEGRRITEIISSYPRASEAIKEISTVTQAERLHSLTNAKSISDLAGKNKFVEVSRTYGRKATKRALVQPPLQPKDRLDGITSLKSIVQ